MIVLDSSFIIDFLNGKKETLEKLKELKDKRVLATSISEYEVMFWEYFQDPSNKRIEKAVSFFNSIPIVNFNTNAALKAALIKSELMKKGKEIDSHDCMIAGIAISNGCNEIVTNDNHFKRISELKVINY